MLAMKAAAFAVMVTIAAGTRAADSGTLSKPAPAQKPHVKWAKEPQQFMGITVDGSESNLCHIAVPDFSPCLVMGELTNLPDLGFSIDGSAFEFEHRVAYISLKFDHSDAMRMAQLLIQKFGAPTAKRAGVVTSVMGVKASDTQYEWSGLNVHIVFKEHDDSITRGSVLVTNIPVWNAYRADYLKRNGNPVDHL